MWFGLPAMAALAVAASTTGPIPIVVMPFTIGEGVSPSTAEIVQSVVTAELAREPALQVVSTEDVVRMLELSVDRALLGCSSTDSACSTDIASALGADRLVTGTVTRDEEFFVVTITLLDGEDGKQLGRERVLGRTVLEVSERVRMSAARHAARVSGKELRALPPLVVSRRMSDDDVLQGAAVVGLSSALAGALCALPWGVCGIASVLVAVPQEIVVFSIFALLPIPAAACTSAGVASLVVDACSDEPLGVARAFLMLGIAAAPWLVLLPMATLFGFVMGGILEEFDLVPTDLTAEENIGRVWWASAVVASPLVVVASGLVASMGAVVGIGLFDEEREISEAQAAAASVEQTPTFRVRHAEVY